MSDPKAVVWNYLQANGWVPRTCDDPDLVYAQFQGRNSRIMGAVEVREEAEWLVCRMTPIDFSPAPADKFAIVAEFFTRVNYSITFGSFQFDLDGGILRFSAELDYYGDELTEALARNVLLSSAYTCDEYCAGLRAIYEENMTAQAAFNLVERNIAS